MGKRNKSLALGIVYKAVPIPQAEGDEPVDIWVRGLSPADIAAVMRDDGGDGLGALYLELTTGAQTPEAVMDVGLKMINDLPDLAARVIARAADLPEQWETVRDFATGAQMELLQAITLLTFQSESVGKKAMEIVSQFAKERFAKPLLSESKTGSGD